MLLLLKIYFFEEGNTNYKFNVNFVDLAIKHAVLQ